MAGAYRPRLHGFLCGSLGRQGWWGMESESRGKNQIRENGEMGFKVEMGTCSDREVGDQPDSHIRVMGSPAVGENPGVEAEGGSRDGSLASVGGVGWVK